MTVNNNFATVSNDFEKEIAIYNEEMAIRGEEMNILSWENRSEAALSPPSPLKGGELTAEMLFYFCILKYLTAIFVFYSPPLGGQGGEIFLNFYLNITY